MYHHEFDLSVLRDVFYARFSRMGTDSLRFWDIVSYTKIYPDIKKNKTKQNHLTKLSTRFFKPFKNFLNYLFTTGVIYYNSQSLFY